MNTSTLPNRIDRSHVLSRQRPLCCTLVASRTQVDEQLKKLDGMDRDELEEMEIVRARRIEQLKAQRAKRQQGHGECVVPHQWPLLLVIQRA